MNTHWPSFWSEQGFSLAQDHDVDGLLSEARRATAIAAIVDLAARSRLHLRGRDAGSFLHSFCTQEIRALPVGQTTEAFVTNHQARIQAWCRVAVLAGDHLTLDADPGLNVKLATFLEKYHVTEDFTLEDRTADEHMLAVVGPDAPRLLADLFPRAADLAETKVINVTWDGHAVSLERWDELEVPGFRLTIDEEHFAAFARALFGLGLQPIGTAAWECLRVSAGVPIYGRDLSEAHLPQEADRTERAISFTKGCYAGQETVARLRTYGHVNKQLTRLTLPDLPADAAHDYQGCTLKHAGQDAGTLSSVAPNYRGAGCVALGIVRRGHTAAETELVAESSVGTTRARVVGRAAR